MRVALISDIHGNLTAFKAVLADSSRSSVDQIVFLGDAATLGPQPKEVVELLRDLKCPCVMGNHDSYLLNFTQFLKDEHADWAKETLAWGVSHLSKADIAFLDSFQPIWNVKLDSTNSQINLLCFHGSPKSYDDMILSVTPAVELDNFLVGQVATFMACGHTHVQMMRRHRDVLIVNAGSVGSPMEEMPFTGEPRLLPWAEYAIVDYQKERLSIQLRQVPYDLDLAKQAAFTSGLPYAAAWVELWKKI